jgi:DNA-binding MarR family transcriptional regulator
VRHSAGLRRSEQVAREEGLTPQQYFLLLLIKGAPDGAERATVTDLAQRLQLGQSTVTELVQRAAEAGFLRRQPSADDGHQLAEPHAGGRAAARGRGRQARTGAAARSRVAGSGGERAELLAGLLLAQVAREIRHEDGEEDDRLFRRHRHARKLLVGQV